MRLVIECRSNGVPQALAPQGAAVAAPSPHIFAHALDTLADLRTATPIYPAALKVVEELQFTDHACARHSPRPLNSFEGDDEHDPGKSCRRNARSRPRRCGPTSRPNANPMTGSAKQGRRSRLMICVMAHHPSAMPSAIVAR